MEIIVAGKTRLQGDLLDALRGMAQKIGGSFQAKSPQVTTGAAAGFPAKQFSHLGRGEIDFTGQRFEFLHYIADYSSRKDVERILECGHYVIFNCRCSMAGIP